MSLKGKKLLMLAEDGYQDLELWYPKIRLEEEGIRVTVAGREKKGYVSEHGYPVQAEARVSELNAGEFDAVIIPGGRACPDRLRTYPEVLDLIRSMDREGKVVAAICHAAWVPISSGIVKGRRMTCYHSVRDDVKNAGAIYSDTSVVVDDNLVTSRHPGDLVDFTRAVIEALKVVYAKPRTLGRPLA